MRTPRKEICSVALSGLWLALTFSQVAFGQEPKIKNLDKAVDQAVTEATEVSEGTAKRNEAVKSKTTEAVSNAHAAPAAITAGSIAKFTVTGDALSVMDSTIVESTDLNIGIGTGAVQPQERLHIVQNGDYQLRLENRTTGGGFWNIGQSDNSFNTGGGKLLFVPNTTNSSNATVAFTNSGRVGIGTGTMDPKEKLHIVQSGDYQLRIENPAAGGGFWSIGQSDNTFNIGGGKLAFVPNSTISSNATVVFANSGEVTIGNVLRLNNIGCAAGIGVVSPFNCSNYMIVGQTNGSTFINSSGAGSIHFRHNNNEADQMEIRADGTTAVRVLQILGGADVSEQFEVSAPDTASAETHKNVIDPGMVVSIDPKHPGRLAISTTAYDRRAAGVISGAGGVKPGMMMGQEGTLADGQHPVALSGRVYCWADASNGPIEPGDMLTTSDTPGHAMKVTDHAQAQGAIIGKAMTELKQGKGLVLVLVTLQ